MSIPDVLTLLTVFVATPLSWYVAIRLWSLSRSAPELGVLRSHAIAALALAIIVTAFAAVFVNNGLVPPPLNSEQTKYVTRGTVLIVSTVASVYWLVLYRKSSS